jgi:hypothetical protein
MKKICAGFHALRDESAELEFQQGLSYPIIKKNTMDHKIMRIG